MSTKHHGLQRHRLDQNPLEEKAALSWDEANKGDMLDYLLDDRAQRGGRPPGSYDKDCKVAATVIQWLGSPVGFNWLVETLGDDVTKEVKRRRPGCRIRPGQVYRDAMSREVAIVGQRYDEHSRLARTGPESQWTVHNRKTNRKSYIKERLLLDTAKWERVK